MDSGSEGEDSDYEPTLNLSIGYVIILYAHLKKTGHIME